MTPAEFTELYTRQSQDESITTFQSETGFSLIRFYPEGSDYNKDGKRMFIKVAALERGFFYSVEMTKPEQRGESSSYIIVEGKEYKKKVTNFFSSFDNQEFSFDVNSKKVTHLPSKKIFSLNQFIEILVKNHLSDRLFWKRVTNEIVSALLKVLFWLSDKQYERIRVAIDKYHASRDNKPLPIQEKNIEPFFKYFLISKNILFALLLFAVPASILLGCLWKSGDFSLSNPSVVLLFFLVLFTCEKLSMVLDNKIRDFFGKDDFNKKRNFIEKLHDYQFRNEFKLKV